MVSEMAATNATSRFPVSFPLIYGLMFLAAGILSVVMLGTDKNLQTDFGTVSSGYFLHWYGVLAMSIVDFLGAALLFLRRSRTMIKLGTIGSGLLTLANVGVILTFAQVGFSSATSFAQYLFGITYYGGDVRYLYDVLLAVYLVTFLSGAVSLATTRHSRASPGEEGAQVISSS